MVRANVVAAEANEVEEVEEEKINITLEEDFFKLKYSLYYNGFN
tara:strand:- start:563 stop:694 length:132 start_codon:yes stop_codon:yes gene_type:complete